MSRQLKVGIFVLLGFIGASAVIFLIGDNKAVFDSKMAFRAYFDDVQGLKRGSTVRMGGVNIGAVSSVRYPDDVEQRRIEVVLDVVEREARRIRADSLVSIEPKGLLGDKMLSVTAGSPTQPALQAGDLIESSAAQDFTAILGRIDTLSGRAEGVLENLESATSTLADEQLSSDLKSAVAALSHILTSLDSGQGYAARFLHDESEAARISSALDHLESSSQRVDSLLAGVERAVAQVNAGPGLAHEVLYGEDGARALAQFGLAAAELAQTLRGVREGDGLARGLLFGDGGDERVAGDVARMSDDLRAIVHGLREGKGTLGALLVDPSVYEDLKLLLGNVQRNQALRALVRYSIERDEGVPQVEVVDPNPVAGESQPAAQR